MVTNTYATAAIAEIVGISKTSVSNYASILEQHGYTIARNARQHREFTERDIEIVKALIALNKQRGIKLNDAAQLVLAPDFELSVVFDRMELKQSSAQQVIPVAKYDDLTRSMELLASHMYGIEQQNTQLLELIQAQRVQNELLMEQNNTLKQELGSMMNHLLEKASEPEEKTSRQLNRLEQQNGAMMSVLNRINTQQYEQQLTDNANEQLQSSQAKGLFSKFFK